MNTSYICKQRTITIGDKKSLCTLIQLIVFFSIGSFCKYIYSNFEIISQLIVNFFSPQIYFHRLVSHIKAIIPRARKPNPLMNKINPINFPSSASGVGIVVFIPLEVRTYPKKQKIVLFQFQSSVYKHKNLECINTKSLIKE